MRDEVSFFLPHLTIYSPRRVPPPSSAPRPRHTQGCHTRSSASTSNSPPTSLSLSPEESDHHPRACSLSEAREGTKKKRPIFFLRKNTRSPRAFSTASAHDRPRTPGARTRGGSSRGAVGVGRERGGGRGRPGRSPATRAAAAIPLFFVRHRAGAPASKSAAHICRGGSPCLGRGLGPRCQANRGGARWNPGPRARIGGGHALLALPSSACPLNLCLPLFSCTRTDEPPTPHHLHRRRGTPRRSPR